MQTLPLGFLAGQRLNIKSDGRIGSDHCWSLLVLCRQTKQLEELLRKQADLVSWSVEQLQLIACEHIKRQKGQCFQSMQLLFQVGVMPFAIIAFLVPTDLVPAISVRLAPHVFSFRVDALSRLQFAASV